MSLHVYKDLLQCTDEWYAARCGLVTASAVSALLTPSMHWPSTGETAMSLTRHLVAERITGHVEPSYQSWDMMRGHMAEPVAREYYSEHYAKAVEVGFMVRDDWGFKIGYSPDGLVGDDGLIEIKAPRQKQHLATILDDAVPTQYMAQCQTGLLVSGRAWIDYVSYCAGMPLYVKRVLPDPRWHEAIRAAVEHFERTAAEMIVTYHEAVKGRPETEYVDYGDGDLVI